MHVRKNLREYFLVTLRVNLSFLLVLCVSLVEVFLNIGRMIHGDSYQYLSFARFLLGKGGYIPPLVVTRPMVPFLASALTLVFHNIYLSFGLISGFFWISGTIIAYKIGQLVLEEKNLATAVALSYTIAPVLLLTGAAVLTDSAGFFFIGLTIYLTLKRERTRVVSSKTYFLDAFICSVGILFRESVLLALLFMFSRRLIKRKGFLEFLLAALLVGATGLLYLHLLGFDISIFAYKYNTAQRTAPPGRWGFVAYATSFAIAYVTCVPAPKPYFMSINFWVWTVPTIIYVAFTLLGFIFSKRKKDLLPIMLFLFPSSLIWPEMSCRFFFLMWPAVIPAMINGMNTVLSRLLFSDKWAQYRSFILSLYIIVFAIVNTISILAIHSSLTIAHARAPYWYSMAFSPRLSNKL